ncbi:Adenine specific DNA methylase Mod [Legionella pneumophila]|uniref:site-specific DNA-methyltransferase n=1 Tax=Legionella pneumophila TaxID=446 RepID=UPI0007707F55|nr:DNA methyltransferase [Legionella pneumophila]CZG55093.1 Adenine specific DNA methylase Mod [Legionella pneumophila]
MAAIHDLILQISDSRVRERLCYEWAIACKEKKFGLVFEQHLPELLPLYNAKPQKGDLVSLLNDSLKNIWRVKDIQLDIATCIKLGNEHPHTEFTNDFTATAKFSMAELLVVKEFGEPIFPALIPIDSISNGPENIAWHTLIEADNYHALQLLDYLYAEKVDCIYIDPPYNTGARDWKYNNDYIDNLDSWRHSKWLAFMEKRLKLAKKLLNPNSGVLIVTIDEKEYLRLGLLLEEIFPEAKMQMVSSLINPKGTGRANEMLRVNEFIFFIWFEGAKIGSFEVEKLQGNIVNWETMRRRNLASKRGRKGKGACGPNQFYPIYVNKQNGNIEAIGNPLSEDIPINKVAQIEGCETVLPIRNDGTEMNWSLTSETCKSRWKKGFVRAGKHTPDQPQRYIMQFLPAGAIKAIENGQAEILYRKDDGSVEAYYKSAKDLTPSTQWNIKSHYAEHNGTNLLKEIIPNCNFPFPKSVYAVRDALKIFVAGNPDALILDFFSGSGTTLNAVNLLNASDNGQRRCIMVTNNEVSSEETELLQKAGLRPGEEEWEVHGICRSITWPRSKYTIQGHRDDGSELPGEYHTGQTVQKQKSRKFSQISFIELSQIKSPEKKKQLVSLINGLSPTLVDDNCKFIASEKFSTSILFDINYIEEYLDALEGKKHIIEFFIITSVKKKFLSVKEKISQLLGPIQVIKEEQRLMKEGFSANLAYFKLDFLTKEQVSLRRAFKEILPLLWLKSGAIGKCPTVNLNAPEPNIFGPPQGNFIVLLNEIHIVEFLKIIKKRSNLSHIYIVTDADETFKSIALEINECIFPHNPNIQVFQLYRDYLQNFMINKTQEMVKSFTPSEEPQT